MAEIKIQRRQRSPWPWILGIIVLGAFIWFLLTYVYMPENNDNKVLAGDSTHTGQRYETPVDTVNEVRDFIEYTRDTTKLNPKNYTEKGLIKLQSALSYVADRTDSSNRNVEIEIDSLDRIIVKIDTTARNYLTQVKPAFSAAVNALQSIRNQENKGQASSINNLKNTEASIDTNKSLQSQVSKIRQFFAEAGEILQQISQSYAYTTNQKSY
ncbi:MAG TPA: hypothetical protein VKD08_16010 [Ignavibacteriaceae bacterium]|jgi:hypothetical protein|nr:hypothetical protein [Ignavibacteriaceae bacterium]